MYRENGAPAMQLLRNYFGIRVQFYCTVHNVVTGHSLVVELLTVDCHLQLFECAWQDSVHLQKFIFLLVLLCTV